MDKENKEKSTFTSFKEAYEEGMEFSQSVRMRKEMIAVNIRTIRLSAKMTQSEFADKIKVNRITYSGYEVARAEPPVEVLVRISDLFNVSLDTICREQKKAKEVVELEQEIEMLKKRIEELESK